MGSGVGGAIFPSLLIPPPPAPENDRILLRRANTRPAVVVAAVYAGVIWTCLNWDFPELKDFIKYVGLLDIAFQLQIWNELPPSSKPVSMEAFGSETTAWCPNDWKEHVNPSFCLIPPGTRLLMLSNIYLLLGILPGILIT